MTQATKTLSIIFIVLLTLSVLAGFYGNRDSSEVFRSQLTTFDPGTINRIEINNPKQEHTIVLSRRDDKWFAAKSSGTREYEADQNIAEQTLADFSDLKINSLVTRDPEKFTRFRVDTTGTRVSFYNNEIPAEEVIVGAPQVVSQREFNTYLRLTGSNEVYSVEGFLNAGINRDLDGWRDKEVWNIDRDSITRVEFAYPADSSFSISKIESGKWVSEGDSLDESKTNRLLRQISSLNASGFTGSPDLSQFGEALYTIRTQTEDGNIRTLQIKPGTENENHYEITASGYPYVFTVQKSAWDASVLRTREELFPS